MLTNSMMNNAFLGTFGNWASLCFHPGQGLYPALYETAFHPSLPPFRLIDSIFQGFLIL